MGGMGRRGWWAAAVLVASLALRVGSHPPSVWAATLTYTPGWHLVAAPPGTVFHDLSALYRLDPASARYVALPLDQPTAAGVGYFAYFTDTVILPLAADLHTAVQVPLAAGRWTLVGNPSAYSDATVFGADRVYNYDPQGGFLIESSLPPGAGALVYSQAGGTASIQPIPAGIEGQLAALTDRLVAAALQPGDVPERFHLTRADTNGAQAAGIPATYIEEFRPRTPPTATDADQTALVQVNLQQATDASYARTLLMGTTAQSMRDRFGTSVQTVETLPAPSVGEAAVLYAVQLANGSSPQGVLLLAFQRQQLLVTLVLTAPAGHTDQALLQTLALAQDTRLLAAFARAPLDRAAAALRLATQGLVRGLGQQVQSVGCRVHQAARAQAAGASGEQTRGTCAVPRGGSVPSPGQATGAPGPPPSLPSR